MTKVKLFIRKIIYNQELLLVGSSQVISLISSVVFIKLVSHYATVSEYGLYSLILSIVAFIALFPFSAFDQAISRYVPIYHDKNIYTENYTNILYMYVLLLGILTLLFILFYIFFKPYIQPEIVKLFNTVIVFTVLSIFRTTILQIENFNRNRIIVLYSRIFEGVLRILLLIIVINYSSVTAQKILLISSIIFTINILWILLYQKEHLTIQGIRSSLLRKNFKTYYKFASPLLVWAVFGWLQLYAITWFLQYYRSVEEVGYFTLLNTIAVMIPTQLVGIIGTFIMPIMYQNEHKQKGYTKRKVKEITYYLILLYIGVGAFFFAFHNVVIEFLSSEKYTFYGWLLPYLFFASAISSIATIWTYEFFVYNKTKKLLIAQTVPSIVSVISSLILIPVYGLLGVTYVLLLSYGVYLILIFLTYYKSFIYGETA